MKDQGHVIQSYISIFYEILHTGTNKKDILQKLCLKKYALFEFSLFKSSISNQDIIHQFKSD